VLAREDGETGRIFSEKSRTRLPQAQLGAPSRASASLLVLAREAKSCG
jgi:hypothetical protein